MVQMLPKQQFHLMFMLGLFLSGVFITCGDAGLQSS